MASDTVDLKSEERRRQVTLMVLGGLLFASTLPVVNQRALFSPLGDVPILGELSPVAYAMIVGAPPRFTTPRFAPHPRGPGSSDVPPVAYAVRVPGDPVAGVPPTGRTPIGGTPVGFGPTSGPGLALNGPPGGIGPTGTVGPGGGTGGGFNGGGGGGGGGGGVPGGGGGTTPGPIGAVPEPATWLTMILGFGIVGGIMRRARRQDARRRRTGMATGISGG